MNDESLITEEHITINSSWSDGQEDVNDLRPKNQGDGTVIFKLYHTELLVSLTFLSV